MKIQKANVLFQPSGLRGQVETGKTVLEAAREIGVAIESVCGGKHTCGKCKIRVENGEAADERSPLSPFSAEEGKFITAEERKDGYRLACLAEIREDLLLYLPEESRGTRQVIRKEARPLPCKLNPAVKSYHLELRPPSLQEPQGDFERLQRGLERAYGLKGLTIDLRTLQLLPERLRSKDWEITVFVWMDREILDVRPGEAGNFYGMAVDLGTTTVAAYLCSLRDGRVVATQAMMNPQVTHGEDVMARITLAMTDADGLRRMQEAIVGGLNGLVQAAAAAAAISPEEILEMTVVGNTAMHHIFLGIDPRPLGASPFSPALHRSLEIKARDLGLRIHPAANLHLLPIEAGFVGADNVGVLIATTPYEKEEMVLIIDIGTNGELVLGNRQRLLSTSCATGPALEGAHLKFGMRAAPGAIERVRIDPQSGEVKFKVIGLATWSDETPPGAMQTRGICGSGIIEAVAEMFTAGILEKSGRFSGRGGQDRLRQGEKGAEFVIARAEETAIGRDITISIADIRAVQLAKGALYTGAKVMMKALGIAKLDRVILAGAFGSSIDPQRAMTLGIFPDCALEKVVAVGNAAGDGARLALLSREKRAEADCVARAVEYIELTSDPGFMEEFVDAMSIPHAKDPFPHLEKIFPLSQKD